MLVRAAWVRSAPLSRLHPKPGTLNPNSKPLPSGEERGYGKVRELSDCPVILAAGMRKTCEV